MYFFLCGLILLDSALGMKLTNALANKQTSVFLFSCKQWFDYLIDFDDLILCFATLMKKMFLGQKGSFESKQNSWSAVNSMRERGFWVGVQARLFSVWIFVKSISATSSPVRRVFFFVRHCLNDATYSKKYGTC